MVIAEGWVKLDRVDRIKDGVTAFRKNRRKLAVYMENNEVVSVFQDSCPHNDKILISNDFRIEFDEGVGKQITCAFHGACFNLDNGETVKGPSPNGIRIYEFQINKKNELLVNLAD